MFLHLGDNIVISKNSIISIFNMNNFLNSEINKELIDIVNSEKKVIKIGDEEKIKTLIITEDNIYLSPISASTLNKRFYTNIK